MAWFRRNRTARPDAGPTAGPESGATPGTDAPTDDARLPVPVASAPALARTERALLMLAAQSSQLHTCIVQLEHRVDALSDAMLDQLDRPSFDDLVEARMHSAKVAGELSRLEVNLAARLESVRAEIRELRGEAPIDIDLRDLTPVDSGF